MNVYLASRYSRIEEMKQVRSDLEELGHIVTSRWINGNHQIGDGLCAEEEMKERIRFAEEDWTDVVFADIVISFTEEPRQVKTRGGRHVEFGAALAFGCRCITIGPRENIFHYLRCIEQFDTWEECLERLRREENDRRKDDQPGITGQNTGSPQFSSDRSTISHNN